MIGLIARAVLGFVLLLSASLGLTHWAHSGNGTIPDRRDEAFRIATLNVHWIALQQSEGPWSPAGFEARSGPLQDVISAIEPDILALQEAESFPATNRDGTNLAVEFLLDAFPDYGIAASGHPAHFPPTQPILFRRDRLDMVDQGWFFFSDTPDVIYSQTFNGSYPAFASWAEFRPRDGAPAFRVVNIHTDYASRSNRRRSAELVRDRVAPWTAQGTPVMIVGDMNALSGSYTLRTMSEAGVEFLAVRGATMHFNRGLNLFGAIDHIGVSPGMIAEGTVVVRQKFGDIWPSDHYPVFADIRPTP